MRLRWIERGMVTNKIRLGVTDIASKMGENRLRCFGRVIRKNNDWIVVKMGEIRVEESQR